MRRAIAKIQRNNHYNHLIKSLPFIAIVFGIQCYVISSFGEGMYSSDYALFLGASLSLFIWFLAHYDTHHHIFLYEDRIHIYFSLTGTNKEIHYHAIKEIIAPKEESPFSSLILKLENNETVVWYFVDYPVQTKSIIENQKKLLSEKTDDQHNMAA